MRAGKGGLSVVLYEPLAQGGICHYTYNLAESLARAGCRVTLLTGDDYELAHLPRRFRLVSIFNPSWIRPILSALTGRHAVNAPGQDRHRPEEVSGSDAKPKVAHRARGLQRFRLRLIFLRAIGRILAARSRILHVQWSAHREEELRFFRLLKGLGVRTVYTAHDLSPNGPAKPGDREALSRLYQAFDHVVVFAGAEPTRVHRFIRCCARQGLRHPARQREHSLSDEFARVGQGGAAHRGDEASDSLLRIHQALQGARISGRGVRSGAGGDARRLSAGGGSRLEAPVRV